MKDISIIAFMEQLSKGKYRPTDMPSAAESDVEFEALHELWHQHLSPPVSDMASESERVRFCEKLHAYQEGLCDKSHTERESHGIFGWRLYVTAIAALLVVAFGIDQINYHATLKSRQMNSEISELKELLALTLIRQNTATDRIDGVVWAADLKNPEPMLIDELIRMLSSDPSINVRLAALNSLAPFSENPEIRKSLIEAIGQQHSSLITLNICKILIQHPRPEEYPALIQQLENSGLGADYLERFRKTLTPQI